MLHKKGDRNKRLKDRQRPQVQRRRRQQRRQIDKELRDYLVNDEQFQFQPYYREPNFFEPQQLPDWDYIEQGQQDALCELQVEYAISEAESYDWWDQCDKEFKQRKLDKLIQTSQLRVKLLPIFKQQQQQKQQKQQQSTTQINERIFRQVWNNIFLKRLICSKIRTISQDNLIKLENYFTEYMEEYFEDPNLFIERRGIYKIYECPLITVDLFAYHYERCHDKIKGSNDSVLERLSANPRNMVDTWLFRRAFEYMKYTDPCELYDCQRRFKPSHLNNYEYKSMWRNIIKSNNVELYNYVKTVLPLPSCKGLKNMVCLACKPYLANRRAEKGHRYFYRYGFSKNHEKPGHDGITRPPGTKLLKTLLNDLEIVKPNKIWWFGWEVYQVMIQHGFIGTLEKLHNSYQINVDLSYLYMAILHKQIDSIRLLHRFFNIPDGQDIITKVADTCDLPFIIAFHNIDPEAGRLYTIFLYTMSSSFHLGPIHLCSSKNDWLDFQKEFYKHVIKLDYIDDNLQYHIDNRQPFHFNMETKYKPMKLIS